MQDISEELLASWSRRRYGGPGPRTFVQGDDGMYRIGAVPPEQAAPAFNRMTSQGAIPVSRDMPIPEPLPKPATPPIGNQLLAGLADNLLNAFQGMPAGVLENLQPAPQDIAELLADDSVPIGDRLRMAHAMADRQGIQLGFRRAQPGANGKQPMGAFEAVVIDPETAAQLPQGYARGLQAVGSMLNIGQIDPVAGTGAAIARGVQGVRGAERVMGEGVGPISETPLPPGKRRAWHGSPHDYDKFDLTKVGTGEGAQAFGWGGYVAEAKTLGETYRDRLTNGSDARDLVSEIARSLRYKIKGEDVSTDTVALELRKYNELAPFAKDRAVLSDIAAMANGHEPKLGTDGTWSAAAMTAMQRLDKVLPKPAKGKLYEVAIPDEDTYLLWDKPLSQQPEGVRKALDKFIAPMREKMISDASSWGTPSNAERAGYAKQADEIIGGMSGEEIYKALAKQAADLADKNPEEFFRKYNGPGGLSRASSLMLLDAGIPGIKYLDGNSRSGGAGTHNYVLFDDKLIEILKKYGIIGAVGGAAAANEASAEPNK